MTVATGLAGLSLDALASVAYGPESIVLVLALAGAAGLGFTLPVTCAVVALLVMLTISYRQVIGAFPDGGGAYAVANRRLGRRWALVAASSLVVDYVLNVAVSIAAGVAALTSAVPALLPYTLWISLGALAVLCSLNLRGLATSAKAMMAPTVLFVLSVAAVILAGLARSAPSVAEQPQQAGAQAHAVGVLLLLKAFSSGCSALTGVEAIANATPAFRRPAIKRAQRTEIALGAALGVMLLGVAALVQKFHIRPVDGITVLSQVTEASLGRGSGYFLVQASTVVLLALAANTSYGGLPNLLKLLANDDYLPHRFSVRNTNGVYSFGVLCLTGAAAAILVLTGAEMNALVPLFAIGVFIGFTIAQTGMARHWLVVRPLGWRRKLAVAVLGATLTALAVVITTAVKFGEGAWLVAVTVPACVWLMGRTRREHQRSDTRRKVGETPEQPRPKGTLVVVPVSEISSLAKEALATALSLGRGDVVAVHVQEENEQPGKFSAAWARWQPEVELVQLDGRSQEIGLALAEHVNTLTARKQVLVLLAEPDRKGAWERVLPTGHVDDMERCLRKETSALICRMRIPVGASAERREPSAAASLV
ncbi:hypothetical protein HMPREF9336_02536 [Segniliparus rugosus ATCC BAA-974]|uniref:Amino acid transporter n=1 Tax=Segniliparus rugosus (strain ATCC BAA-974 / DSM 45345 / CCUG 50838 / CIP 108380 / JCM 13579 / CDC 945) TaxID=679197 RepID=E5XSR4_SEGRC|nr:hypothetical protein HMPREF9336_02536 [Segniliparus rugosus ATCC BAA-974]